MNSYSPSNKRLHWLTSLCLSGVLGVLIILFALFLAGCGSRASGPSETETDLPSHIDTVSNLYIHSVADQSFDTVVMVREQSFGRNGEVLFQGRILGADVDSKGRVYISEFNMGVARIHQYSADGKHLASAGEFGKGPGQYQSLSSTVIANDTLVVLDNILQKISLYDLEDFRFIRDELINKERMLQSDTLAYASKAKKLLTGQDHLVIQLGKYSVSRDADIAQKWYYPLTMEGEVLPERLLEIDRYRLYYNESQPGQLPGILPSGRSSHVEMTSDGEIYTNWNEDFLIKHFDAAGDYLDAIYYPYEKSSFSLQSLDLGRSRREPLEGHDIPNTWPAVHAMEIDDQDRLWVATITDSDSTYKWWVLDTSGSLLARFDWPGNRMERSPMSSPSYEVQGDHFYTLEADSIYGGNRVVKYHIHFRES